MEKGRQVAEPQLPGIPDGFPPIPPELTPQQALFCREYVRNHCNGTRAAVLAGYSQRTACKQASRLLTTNVHIREYLRKIYLFWTKDIENTLAELAGVAHARLEDYATWDEEGRVTLRLPEEIPEQYRPALKKLKQHRRIETRGRGGDSYQVETVDLEIELHDKIAALRELRRHIGGGADLPGEQAAISGVTVVIAGFGPLGFERQEPAEQQEIEEG